MRKVLFPVLAASLVLSLASCGAGSPIPTPLTITVFNPDVLYSHEDRQVRILGVKFGPRSTKVTVQLHAESGTPFHGGTADMTEFEATVDSDTQVRGMLPATFVTDIVHARVSVVLASGDTTTTEEPVAVIEPQEVTAITPTLTLSGSTPEYEITGNGFRPALGLVTVRFTAESGTPFQAGSASNVTTIGTVVSPTSIVGNLPNGVVDAAAMAYVTVILTDGGEFTSAVPLIQFEPQPAVIGFSPNVVTGGITPNFAVSGTSFGPVTVPPTNATVTLTATSGTPFLGGTSDILVFLGQIDSPSAISGVMPDSMVDALTFATVTVDLPAPVSLSVSSTGPLVNLLPGPSITGILPTTMYGGQNNPFLISGENFSPVAGNCSVTFTADSGTPFQGGTSATQVVPSAFINSNTQITGTLLDPAPDVTATCSISIQLQTGATASTGPGAVTIEPLPPFTPPAWDTNFGNTVSLGDDATSSQSLGFTFPYFSGSQSSIFVNSNGNATFGSGYTSFSESTGNFASRLMIAPFWDDFNPASGGTVYFRSSSTEAVVSWVSVPEYFSTGANSFQIKLYDTGRIDIVHNGIQAGDGIVGISPGNSNLNAVDFSATSHPDRTNTGSTQSVYQQWFSGGSDFDPGWLVFEPDGSGGYDFATGS